NENTAKFPEQAIIERVTMIDRRQSMAGGSTSDLDWETLIGTYCEMMGPVAARPASVRRDRRTSSRGSHPVGQAEEAGAAHVSVHPTKKRMLPECQAVARPD